MRKLLILLVVALFTSLAVYVDWVGSPAPTVTRGRRGYPTEVERMAWAKQALEKLPNGKAVFDAPKMMKVGDVRTAHAGVGVNVPIEVLARYSHTESQKVEATLKVAYQMSAVLTGSAFKITPLNAEKQAVADGYPTFWNWNVEPIQEGEQELEVTLYVFIPLNSNVQQRVDSFRQSVMVSIKDKSWLEWLTSSEQAVTAAKALIAAASSAIVLGAGWIRWFSGKRRKAKPLHTSRQAKKPPTPD